MAQFIPKWFSKFSINREKKQTKKTKTKQKLYDEIQFF